MSQHPLEMLTEAGRHLLFIIEAKESEAGQDAVTFNCSTIRSLAKCGRIVNKVSKMCPSVVFFKSPNTHVFFMNWLNLYLFNGGSLHDEIGGITVAGMKNILFPDREHLDSNFVNKKWKIDYKPTNIVAHKNLEQRGYVLSYCDVQVGHAVFDRSKRKWRCEIVELLPSCEGRECLVRYFDVKDINEALNFLWKAKTLCYSPDKKRASVTM